jgi:porphobilinogen synthase
MTALPVRLRRLRKNDTVRRLFRETQVPFSSLMQAYFVVADENAFEEAPPNSGLFRVGVHALLKEAAALVDAGAASIMLFGVPPHVRDDGEGLAEQLAPLTTAVRALKKQFPELVVFCDVCLCSYTAHGHCGLVSHDAAGAAFIDNDRTLPVLADMSVQLAEAGVDFVSPSDMMDGRIAAIRRALDDKGLIDTGILSYAVKMASAFYGPFRTAAKSAPQFGDRKSYQMPSTNRREARREWQLDVDEGADALLVKPALTNLDLIRDMREASDLPIVAYQVSGELAMMRAAAAQGLLDYDRARDETLASIRRAGADIIITYTARELIQKRATSKLWGV